MRVNRSWLNWGIFLVVLGAIPLAVEWGYLDRGTAGGLLRLWPLLLIAVGVGMLLRFTTLHALGGLVVAATLGMLGGALLVAGPGAATSACLPGERPAELALLETGSFSGASVRLDDTSTCADIEVNRGPGTDYRFEAAPGQSGPGVTITGDSITIADEGEGLPFARERKYWRLTMPADPSLNASFTLNGASARINLGGGALERLGATLNASDARIDLADANMSSGSANLTANASSVTLTMPRAGTGASSSITLNAASLTLCVAPETGLRIDFDGRLSSENFAGAGLVATGEVWQTSGYADSAQRVDMRISANVSSITLDRSGGCQ
jgi:hypothetical protein